MTILLDVNLLFVLHQPSHPEFERVKRWFEHRVNKNFATCPITQSGLLRLLIRGVPGLAPYEIEEARDALNHFILRPGHVYWPNDPSYLEGGWPWSQ